MQRILLVAVLAGVAIASLGAKCVVYNWTTPDDGAAYGGVRWNDTPLLQGEYAFTPAYPTHERELGWCSDHPNRLVQRGAFACRSVVLDVELPTGTVEVSDVASLLAIFGPIDNEAEAASFAQATIGSYAHYDQATAVAPNGNFLVRMSDLRDNCTTAAGFYAIVYEVTPQGDTRIVAEQVRPTPAPEGGLCYD